MNYIYYPMFYFILSQLKTNCISFLSIFLYSIMEMVYQQNWKSHYSNTQDWANKATERSVLTFVFYYNEKYVQIANYFKRLYYKYSILQSVASFTHTLYNPVRQVSNQIKNVLFYSHYEPNSIHWLSISYVSLKDVPFYGFQQHYYSLSYPYNYYQSLENILCPFMSCFMGKWYEYHYNLMREKEKIPIDEDTTRKIVDNKCNRHFVEVEDNAELCMILKYNGFIYTRVHYSPNLNLFQMTPVLSNVRLLAVNYTHPDMKNSISIELPNEMYVQNNELLSFIFVLRYLKQLPFYVKYVFDRRYVLTIMDDNIQQFQLYPHQYIILGKNSYVIHSSRK